MLPALDDQKLAEILPGTWSIAATNFSMWVNGDRREPRFSYGLVSADPLVLDDEVSYINRKDVAKTIRGVDLSHGGSFVWRGKGVLRLLTSRWSVIGASEDASVLAIEFSKSLFTAAGIDIIVREGTEHPELRAVVARESRDLGLSAEDFASLTWL